MTHLELHMRITMSSNFLLFWSHYKCISNESFNFVHVFNMNSKVQPISSELDRSLNRGRTIGNVINI